jgi:magnesium transporter
MLYHRGSGGGSGQKSNAMSAVTFHHPTNFNASTYHSSMAGLQSERLHQIVVFEIREDGNTQYSTMTLRSLYNHVVKTITEGCREANRKKQLELQREQQQQQRFSKRNTVNSSSREMFSTSDIFLEDVDEEEGNSTAGVNDAEGVVYQEGPYGLHRTELSTNNGANLTSFPTTPITTSAVPPHYLPSLTTSSSTSKTPHGNGDEHVSNQITQQVYSEDDRGTLKQQHPHPQPPHCEEQQQTQPYSQHDAQQINIPQKPTQRPTTWRAASTFPSPLLPTTSNTYRERLGGYLHPRDMRRLVTPFSSSNEPQLIVRRHVMLLNFDPLRAIVLRDRLLVLVPDGADSILIALEQRVRGGVNEMVNQVFGTASMHDTMFAGAAAAGGGGAELTKKDKSYEQSEQWNGGKSVGGKKTSSVHDSNYLFMESSVRVVECSRHSGDDDNETHITASSSDNNLGQDTTDDEWEELQRMDWQKLPFELQSVDAVLQTVMSMLIEEAQKVHDKAGSVIGEGGNVGDYTQSRLRLHKDAVNLTQRRVQGFIRAMNELLDEDEDMALMNLSRLLTHPERFVQPVSRVILSEESDEPELILEAYLQQALSIVNSLDLLKGQILTTEEQISMMLDAIRNRLLYINTLLSVAMLSVTTGAFIGSIFGMNLWNHIEEDDTAFYRVTYGTLAGIGSLWVILSWMFFRAANIQSNWEKKNV